jgi:membrane glycosyltransferase
MSLRDTMRNYAVPSLFGIAMAGSAYAVSLPLLLWMMPVILGLLLAVPIAMLSSTAGTGRTGRLFRTPEETAPPPVLARANQLAKVSQAIGCPLRELRDDPALREAHLNNLSGVQPRRRGEIDPRLAIARAKIEDAISFDEAVTFLDRGETFAVLNSPGLLKALLSGTGHLSRAELDQH